LVGLIVYLIARAFVRYNDTNSQSSNPDGSIKKDKQPDKKISKEIGEYIDYEELKK
jgi:hypothetical protein